jgi:hypothetical protein
VKTSRRFLDCRLMLGPSQDNAIQTERLATHFYTGGVDIARLPDDVAALIDALRPGEELVITRDGLPIATICGAGGALHWPGNSIG